METLHDLAEGDPRWSLEDFVAIVNRLLPGYLPAEKTNLRLREEVNARLIRHYTTEGLLDAPLREGREARYTFKHLLQVLVSRRLMAEGYGTPLVARQLAGLDEARLEALLEPEPGGFVQSENPALAFLQGLASGPPPMSAPPPAAPPRAAPMAPAPAAKKEAMRAPAAPPMAPAAPAPAKLAAPAPPRWIRLELAPGVELHLREDVKLPPYGQDELVHLIHALLAAAPDDDRRTTP